VFLGCYNNGTATQAEKGASPIQNIHSEAVMNQLNKNSNYIGFVNNFYFSQHKEAYIELYFNQEEAEWEEYEKIVALADSLIYQDDENSRTKFPLELAPKYFDLSGLSHLNIYDDNNNFVCNANFMRVEYLNQNISSCFTAVYRTDKKLDSGTYYCISNFKEKLNIPNYTVTNYSVLTKKILNQLNISRPNYELENNGTHILYNNTDTTLSIINSDTTAYIILSSNKKIDVLYKSSAPEIMWEVIVVPIFNNNMPYLLTKCVMPESDVMWDYLFSFDGINYKPLNRQRIK